LLKTNARPSLKESASVARRLNGKKIEFGVATDASDNTSASEKAIDEERAIPKVSDKLTASAIPLDCVRLVDNLSVKLRLSPRRIPGITVVITTLSEKKS
jgi:hypothetical protein